VTQQVSDTLHPTGGVARRWIQRRHAVPVVGVSVWGTMKAVIRPRAASSVTG